MGKKQEGAMRERQNHQQRELCIMLTEKRHKDINLLIKLSAIGIFTEHVEREAKLP
jgi:hypothetical protein